MLPPPPYPLRFEPILKERIWGGDALREIFARAGAPGRSIGESWELVDRPGDSSRVVNGPLRGRRLGDVLAEHQREIMGTVAPAGPHPFPLIVKYIDAEETLSLQVHPPAGVAAALGGEPKSEMWYVVRAAPGSRIFAGLLENTTREQIDRSLGTERLADLVTEHATAEGDAFFLPAGTVHALGQGNVVVEIQQNSDTTYRIHDWERRDRQGRERDLHVREALESIRDSGRDARITPVPWDDGGGGTAERLVRCRAFVVVRRRFGSGSARIPPRSESCRVWVVLEGNGRLETPLGIEPLAKGDLLLIPAAAARLALQSSAAGMTLLETRLPGPREHDDAEHPCP